MALIKKNQRAYITILYYLLFLSTLLWVGACIIASYLKVCFNVSPLITCIYSSLILQAPSGGVVVIDKFINKPFCRLLLIFYCAIMNNSIINILLCSAKWIAVKDAVSLPSSRGGKKSAAITQTYILTYTYCTTIHIF